MTDLISRKQINTRICRRFGVSVLLGVLAIGPAHAQTSPDGQAPSESLDEAWWTGPMLANSAKTLPAGHALIESYLYDDIEKHSNSYRSLSYLLYGLTDRVTVGLIPTGGANQISGARSGTGIGDTTLQAQYALTSFDARSGIPDISLAFRESLPTGKYDHLDQTSDAFGSGAYTTSVAIFTQDYFWLPNGRLLRGRLDLFESFSSDATITDTSVYGTAKGFLGHARPGDAFAADASLEYSLTQNWVLALDLIYNHGDSFSVRGSLNGGADNFQLGASDSFGYAPAIEYNWSPNIGLLLGARIITQGRNVPASVTPAIAINYVS